MRAPRSPNGSSPRRARSTGFSRVNSRCMPTGAARCQQTRRLAAGQSRGRQDAQPAIHVERQPVFRSQVRTLKSCPPIPRPLRIDRRRTGVRPGVLTLVRPGAPSQWPRVPHAGRGPLRRGGTVRAHRERVLAAAYAAHPERFVNGRPHPADLPSAVWINPPVKKATAQDGPETTIARPDDPQHGRILEATHQSTRIMIDGGAPLINSTLVSQCH